MIGWTSGGARGWDTLSGARASARPTPLWEHTTCSMVPQRHGRIKSSTVGFCAFGYVFAGSLGEWVQHRLPESKEASPMATTLLPVPPRSPGLEGSRSSQSRCGRWSLSPAATPPRSRARSRSSCSPSSARSPCGAFAVGIWRGWSWGRSGGIVTQLLIIAVAIGAMTGACAEPAPRHRPHHPRAHRVRAPRPRHPRRGCGQGGRGVSAELTRDVSRCRATSAGGRRDPSP